MATCWNGVNSFLSPNQLPYVEFTFTLKQGYGPFIENGVELFVGFQSHHAVYGSDTCDTSKGPGDQHYCEVVPEPLTTILLSTGLAGLGAVSLMRRRRRELGLEDG